ncbi:hypothetical protein PUN28_002787 [Cardiocondyla obscurior]|uniref:Uncharacterized protein n=1 Tax=Cardiocondyla obscurior TaxID=286306 RepID=A0AAW2GW20_9HYME
MPSLLGALVPGISVPISSTHQQLRLLGSHYVFYFFLSKLMSYIKGRKGLNARFTRKFLCKFMCDTEVDCACSVT